jgi:hypothetical protein
MTTKIATVTLTIYDSLDNMVDSKEIDNAPVQTYGTPTIICVFLQIPMTASLGEATIYANCYTSPVNQNGVSYCPEVSTSFVITKRDNAILNIQQSTISAYEGETVCIDVTVQNKGTEIESFKVSAYYNETLINTESVSNLQPFMQATIEFQWNTSQLPEGIYRITASVSQVLGESYTSDNQINGDLVEIKSRFHDIAITQIAPYTNVIHTGKTLAIQVIAKNPGHFVESFNVTVCYDAKSIGTIFVEDLEPNNERLLIFQWNTSQVPEGEYSISAFANTAQDERDTRNNIFVDGTVVLTNAPTSWPETDSTYLSWLFALVPVAVLMLILLVLRRQRKEAQNGFRQGWAAWYYGYSVEPRTRRAKRRSKLR